MAGYRLPYPLSVGTLSAGDWASSVPDRLVAEGGSGVALGERVEDARAELERASPRSAPPTRGCGQPRCRSSGGAASSPPARWPARRP
jgi:hypothetical protein